MLYGIFTMRVALVCETDHDNETTIFDQDSVVTTSRALSYSKYGYALVEYASTTLPPGSPASSTITIG